MKLPHIVACSLLLTSATQYLALSITKAAAAPRDLKAREQKSSTSGKDSKANAHSSSLLTDFDEARDHDDKDRDLCDRARYGKNVDRWYKAVERGDHKEAKAAWRVVLNELKQCNRIWFLLLDLRLRWCLGEDDEGANIDRHDYAFHKDLIADTEEAVGRDHRFVADVLTFCGNYFETCGKADEALKAYLRTLEIRTKTSGNNSAETISIKYVLAEHLYKLGKFAESQRFFKDFATSCQRVKEREALMDGVRRYAAMMRRAGKVKEAYTLEAKYGMMIKP